MAYKQRSPIIVSEGGTAKTSFTAYAPILGGTTSTGALQSVASVGTAGQVLTSNGAGAAATFQAAGSGGITTVNGTTGSVTGSTITLTGGTSGAIFTGSGTTMTESFNFLLLPATTSTNGQIRIGSDIVLWFPGNQSNTMVGGQAGNSTMSQLYNTGVGFQAGISLTSGAQNTFLGASAADSVTTGANNVAIGYNALATATTDSNQIAIGTQSLAFANLSGAIGNVSIGHQSLFNLTTGTYNVSIGPANNGSGYTSSESSNITLNANSSTIAAESNVLRIGNATGTGVTQLNKAFIHGIRGITTVAIDALPVLISSTGQLGTVSSSIRFKENVEDMATSSSDILKLRPVTFDLKNRPGSKRQVGLIAEEVYEIMPDLVVHNIDGLIESVKYHELPALLLNELQKAVKRIEVLEAKLAVRID